MIIFSNDFRNYSNEIINLKVEKFFNENQHYKLTIKRYKCLWFRRIFFIIFLIFIIINLWLFQQQNLTLSLFTILIITFITLIYIFQPVVEESVILFDNFQGIEYEKKYLFQKKSNCIFINTNNVIINEAITMQKVIFYLIAIPVDIRHLVLRDSEYTTIDHHQSNNDQANRIYTEQMNLIPLFIHTLPCLDCLKIIYNFIIQFRNQRENEMKIYS